MREFARTDNCRMEFLAKALDDPEKRDRAGSAITARI